MMSSCIEIAKAIVSIGALGRVLGILITKRRQARYAKQAIALPRTWRDRCTVPEPYLLGVTTLALWLGPGTPGDPSLIAIILAGTGALIALLAMGLMLWVLESFPSVSTGHYVLPDHRLVSKGPYGFVRHPRYVAAYLLGVAVAMAYSSLPALALTVAYVIPGYWIYMRAEERMLLDHMGDGYARYQREVGMLVPRWRTISAAASRARGRPGTERRDAGSGE